MIPANLARFLFACLTLALLVACEPLAPDTTPRFMIVTGETQPAAEASPSVAVAATAEMSELAAAGAVNTAAPVPTLTPEAPPQPSPTAFDCAERTGVVIRSAFTSAITGGEVAYRIYQPPCFYETLQRYPYVILLHGTGYDESMWELLGAASVMDQGIAKKSLPPMVLVMPDGLPLSERNDKSPSTSYEAIIIDELIPLIESSLCLWASDEGRAIGGISRGGFWAFSIALRHPEMFSALGGHSPYFDRDNAGDATNPLSLAETANLAKVPLRIYMDNSAADVVNANVVALSESLTRRGIEHQHVVNTNGGHDMDYWSAHMGEYLAFYGQAWPADVSALPSCLEPSPE